MVLLNMSVRKILTIVGIHFTISPLGTLWTFGNLTPYLESYARYSRDSVLKNGAHTEWILAVYMASAAPGLVITGHIARRVGLRWTGVISMVTFITCLATPAWTIDTSILATILLFGFLGGAAAGTAMGVSYSLIQNWCPEHSGLLFATSSSSSNVLAAIVNQVIAYYVNPDNLKPDVQADQNAFFSQTEILDRVPKVIYLITVINLVVQVVGYLLVSEPPSLITSATLEIDDSTNKSVLKSSEEFQRETAQFTNSLEAKSLHWSEKEQRDADDGNAVVSSPAKSELTDEKHPLILDSSKDFLSLRASEAIRTRVFWSVWLTNCTMMLGVLLCNNYYKLFGLFYIPDDQFLSFIGTLMPIVAPISRILFGCFLDKAILSVQDLCVFSVSMNALLFIFMFHSAQVNRYVYLVVVELLALAQSTNFLAVPTAALTLFGPDHYTVNMGMLHSGTAVVAGWAPVGVTPILETFGWFYLFLSTGIISVITLIYVVSTKFTVKHNNP